MKSESAPAFVTILISAILAGAASAGAAAAGLESAWVDSYKTRTRLLAGQVERGGEPRLFAFVEIEMQEGWKTYWRNPGDAGGLPPAFDWSKSRNAASATVLYPAPKRIVDKAGNTIGYKEHVIFPVAIRPGDARQPIELGVGLKFGICKDICVPVDAELALAIPAGTTDVPPPAALEALERVPRGEKELRPADPVLTRIEARLDGASPRLVLEARFPGDGAGADIFLEAPDGLYVPVPQRTKDQGGGKLTFEADLGSDVDLEALKGMTITATLVSDGGASVATFPLRQ